MARARQALILVTILGVAAALRLTALDWDGYQHYHPDERYITWVATTVEFPRDLSSAFHPHRSAFNPFYWPPDATSEGIVVLQDQQRSFAYGHLPLYLGVLATRAMESLAPFFVDILPARGPLVEDLFNGGNYNEFHHLTAVSRALTAVFDVGTVLLVFLLGRRLFGAAAGLLAAAFLSINVMHVQLARFFTVDPYLTFFTVAAIYASVRLSSTPSGTQFWQHVALAAVAIGLAVGSKFSAVLLLLPLAAAIWSRGARFDLSCRKALLFAVAIIGVVFALTNPFAILDRTCDVVSPAIQVGPLQVPSLQWGSCYLENITRQSAMVRGDSAFGFTRQYLGTLPYFYPLLMQVRWGMGYPLGIVAIAGFAWAIWHGRRMPSNRAVASPTALSPEGRAGLVLLAWTLPYFLVTGSFFVKFMRYMQPLTPFLMIYAAALLLRALRGWHLRVVVGGVLAGTALYALAFVNMYQQEHPWNEASRWMYENASSGSLVATELWDDPLPSSMVIDGEYQSRHIYDYTELTWLSGTGSGDDEEKLKLNLSRVAQADYLTISSNRGYGVISRLDDIYPLSSQFYERLFAGDLGFEAVKVAGRSPQLGGFAIWPDRFGGTGLPIPPLVQEFLHGYVDVQLGRADESFTVYDQPLAIIFQNERRLTVDQMLDEFDRR